MIKSNILPISVVILPNLVASFVPRFSPKYVNKKLIIAKIKPCKWIFSINPDILCMLLG